MKKTNKKGFTIVELVIVIAIVAILAAVLIPTFSSIINKANQSSDIQAVRQMNMALAAESVENTPSNIEAVIRILAAAGYNAEDKLIPVSTGHSFYWYKTYNLIVLVKGTNELIYPKDNEAVVSRIKEDIAKTDAEKVLYNLEEGEQYLPDIDEDDSVIPPGTPIPGNTGVDDIKTLFEAGGVYTLNGNITITEPISIANGLIINLNTHTVTFENTGSLSCKSEVTINGEGNIISYNFSDGCITVAEGANLSLSDTNLTLQGAFGVYNEGGTVSISGGVFTVCESNSYNTLLCNESGTMTVEGTTFKEEADNLSIGYYYRAPIFNYRGTIEMDDVNISSSDFCTATYYYLGTMSIDNKDTQSILQLTGRKSPAPCKDYYAYNYDYCLECPTDNTFEEEYAGETITIFKYDAPDDGPAADKPQEDENITLTEEDTAWDYNKYFVETLTIDLKGKTLTLYDCFFSGGNLIITDSVGGGTIHLKNDSGWSIQDYFERVDSVTISTNKEEYINIEGSYLSHSDTIQMIVSKKMISTEVPCEFNNCTFIDSNLSIKNGDTIVFGVDISMGANDLTIPENSAFTFDLNGHTFNLGMRSITVESGASLTIKDTQGTGTLNGGHTGLGKIIVSGTLSIDVTKYCNIDYGSRTAAEFKDEHITINEGGTATVS